MSPRFFSQVTIDCMLSEGLDGLQGDGCVYELSASHQQVSNPSKLRTGDYVKVRLWLPDDNAHISIDLAEVQWIKNHWIKVELLVISPSDQARLKQFIATQGETSNYSPTVTEQILIRA